MEPIYLDYNGTTPIDNEVAKAMLPYLFEHFGNPSSSHPYGITAKRAVENARSQVAEILGCQITEVAFTSGGTESNNYAIKGAAFFNQSRGNHIITSMIEHPAVIQVCKWLEAQGFHVSYLPVDSYGWINPDDLEKAITPQTILVSIMHANNEVGTIQSIKELTAIAHQSGALMHTDAAQSLGKIPVNVDDLGIDLLSIAGHKLYAPKGIGALYIRSGTHLTATTHGAEQESRRRPGTENVLEIVGLGKACEIANRDLEKNMIYFRKNRDHLEQLLIEKLGNESTRVNGHPVDRLPNTLSISFRGVEANTLLSEIGEKVAASAGAACHADQVDVSAVLEAMHVPIEYAMGTVRFTVGRRTTKEEIDQAVEVAISAVQRLQPERDLSFILDSPDQGEYKLTHYTHGMGCACKLRPQALEELLAALPIPIDPDVLVGSDTSDDSAVYRINNKMAIVQSVDFFTPIVDDAYLFGAISATNSLSDIYAMGARPLFALNIIGFPDKRLPLSVLKEILRGAQDKAEEAGISIIGGHTVEDTEPKFGLCVTGTIHPDKLVRNSTAQPGDVLVLTKPIGLGIISTALKGGLANEKTAQEASKIMSTLNREACEAMMEIGVNACTDITGFGFLGHLHEMANGSGVNVEISTQAVPIIAAAWDLAGAGSVPGGTINNLNHVKDKVRFGNGISEIAKLILADAQTSGGLLISLPENRVDELMKALEVRGVSEAAMIGRIIEKGEGMIMVNS